MESGSGSDTSASQDFSRPDPWRARAIELQDQIGDLHTAFASLGQLADLYRDLFDNSPIGYVALDENGAIAQANLAAASLLGMDQAKLVRQPFSRFVDAADRERFVIQARRARLGRADSDPVMLIRPRGNSILVGLHMMSNPEPVGGAGALRIAILDLTQERRTIEALRQRSQELTIQNRIALTLAQPRDLADLLDAGLAILHDEMDLLECWVRLLEEGQMAWSPVFVARPPHSPPDTGAAVESSDPAGRVVLAGEPVIVRAPADSVVNSRVYVPMEAKGQVVGVLAVATGRPVAPESDEVAFLATIARQLGLAVGNARLAQASAEVNILREIDRLRSDLIANVSHELRTPLGLIKLSITSLLVDDVSLSPQVRAGFLRGIEEEVNRLEEQIEHLLDASRIEQHHLVLARETIDLAALARETVESMQAWLDGHRVAFSLPDRLEAFADARRIRQVLRNLVENAINYSPEGTTITLGGSTNSSETHFFVADEGIGIPAREQQRIFDRFYRLEHPRVYETSGVGLGLAICAGIVQAHGGHIWVESKVGQGSTFYFSLPSRGEKD